MYNSRAINPELSKVKYVTSNIFVALVLFFAGQSLFAQDEVEYEVVLPEAAQACVLPAAPDAIPENATKDELLAAKEAIGEFQGRVESYRECLAAAEAGDITPGNKQAIVASYNYSVEMEERVANGFNEAIRDYKARQADG